MLSLITLPPLLTTHHSQLTIHKIILFNRIIITAAGHTMKHIGTMPFSLKVREKAWKPKINFLIINKLI